MSEHRATVSWQRATERFEYSLYNRDHEWQFGGGTIVPASAAPEYLGSGDRVDPEQAYVAAIAACHMLTFLAICARKRLVVDDYRDSAVGFMSENEEGRLAVTRVELWPQIRWQGEAPDARRLAKLHHLAHKECFIANSIRTAIVVRGQ